MEASDGCFASINFACAKLPLVVELRSEVWPVSVPEYQMLLFAGKCREGRPCCGVWRSRPPQDARLFWNTCHSYNAL